MIKKHDRVPHGVENYEVEACARAAYEAHRSYCAAMGDSSHVVWDQLRQDLKEVALYATRMTLDYNLGFEKVHEAWVALKKTQGWTYGEVKNDELKTHPGLVEWSELTPEWQVKDELWNKVVRAVSSALWQIPRQ